MMPALIQAATDVNTDGAADWLTSRIGLIIIVVIGLLMMGRAAKRGATSQNAETGFNVMLGAIVIGVGVLWFQFGETLANTFLN